MTQSFDEWMDEKHGGVLDMPHQRDCYEAGAKSRQAEIDELYKQIDEALEKCYTGIRKQGGEYYLELVKEILEGTTYEK